MIDQGPVFAFFATQPVAYALLNGAHVLFLGLFMGALIPLDLAILRTLGFAWAATVSSALRRVATTAFVLTACTGLTLFAVRPDDYLGNATFLVKIAAIVLGAMNALVFWSLPYAGVRRILAALSLITWLFILFAGRWIGFS
ncbi:hypothetical protein [Pseudomonas syringae group genomosp. 3]|uniref:DUF2214 domain-containing protein n=1 Tax=Pseudomonas syringae pv. viburni TaxID=251703 RepID=A0A0Q0CB61_9PSED|nr:hypothetical protein [Pseudomonas syringae group genomosp. 3]KPZ08362.1 Uncharacterized protein ALO40_03388 [Pseudomonas syringae pv. viburni]